MPLWEVISLLVSQSALLLQFQVVLEETVKIPFPPVAGILMVSKLRSKMVSAAPCWVTVKVVTAPREKKRMVAVRSSPRRLGATL